MRSVRGGHISGYSTSLAMSRLLLEHGKQLHKEAIVDVLEKRTTLVCCLCLYLFAAYTSTKTLRRTFDLQQNPIY